MEVSFPLQEHAHIPGSPRLDHAVHADVSSSSPPLEETSSRLQALFGAHGLLDCNGEMLSGSLSWHILQGLPSMAPQPDVEASVWSAAVPLHLLLQLV